MRGFLQKQVASLEAPPLETTADDPADVDHAFSHLFLRPGHEKKIQQISADEASQLAELDDVRKKADANRGMWKYDLRKPWDTLREGGFDLNFLLHIASALRARFTGRDVKDSVSGTQLPAFGSQRDGETMKRRTDDLRTTAIVGPR